MTVAAGSNRKTIHSDRRRAARAAARRRPVLASLALEGPIVAGDALRDEHVDLEGGDSDRTR